MSMGSALQPGSKESTMALIPEFTAYRVSLREAEPVFFHEQCLSDGLVAAAEVWADDEQQAIDVCVKHFGFTDIADFTAKTGRPASDVVAKPCGTLSRRPAGAIGIKRDYGNFLSDTAA